MAYHCYYEKMRDMPLPTFSRALMRDGEARYFTPYERDAERCHAASYGVVDISMMFNEGGAAILLFTLRRLRYAITPEPLYERAANTPLL